ncbi:hypothetical protein A3B56_01185 [Candidatus Roizmanbacteria bacterium RIFCSPLOWO2_01_FULL_45_11]|uniref:DUF1648 domain-containing protein n=1 Tax=Candidatus Roizmanbacteria bacterium RIFCSPLOWO2_01_FULL_45_11 TaxID=1802070 RepID=A0A1F7JIP6_9BACT|nr:MAG: hypothetical protein A3B56_01185 [Candidatus Roizmanbacteria bacterium RIFCSPLOWO2_01_FULL_45_11]
MRKDPYVMWSAVVAISGIVGCIVFVIFHQDGLPEEVPLMYSLPWGEERLVSTDMLIFVQAGAFATVLINGILEVVLYEHEMLLSRLLALGSLVVTMLTVYTIVRVILVVV